jgi:hypothetical protein
VGLRVLQCIGKCGAGDMSKFERIGHWKTYNLPHQASGTQTIRLSPTKHFSTLEILILLREHICAILGDKSFLTFFHEHWLPGTLELKTSQPRPIFWLYVVSRPPRQAACGQRALENSIMSYMVEFRSRLVAWHQSLHTNREGPELKSTQGASCDFVSWNQL